jgi:hypothetical protein
MDSATKQALAPEELRAGCRATFGHDALAEDGPTPRSTGPNRRDETAPSSGEGAREVRDGLVPL